MLSTQSFAVWAGLRDSPPPGLDPAGLWRLDPAKSDAAEAVIDKAMDALIDNRASGLESRSGRPAGAGGFPSGGGGMTRGSMGGGGLGGGGDFGHDSGLDPEPAHDNTADEILRALEHNPQTLRFQAADHELKVFADDDEVACETGGVVTLSDRLGDGERQCGWQGRVWVIETTRSHAGTRIDRYEFSRDGRSLTYTTLLHGDALPRLKLTRVYAVTR